MDNFMKTLKEYGADVESAMIRLMDDSELYEDCTRAFVHDSAFAELGKAIAEKDYENAFNSAHTLKGVAANLSLAPMVETISVMVEDLRSGVHDNLEMQYSALIKQLEKLKEILSL
ncbi:MAG: Hpt domain-containing protein [Oscillospiraceae bacterium]